MVMSNRERWREVLDAEVRLWSAKPCDELIAELRETCVYEVEDGGTRYQVDVQMLENTAEFVQVMVGIHDGSFTGFVWPLSTIFIQRKKAG
jgi:hypothetical protein